jgi:hypothetical protein
MVAKLSAMTSRRAAGTIESIMVDLYREGDAERGAGITAARFRRHVAMADGWCRMYRRGCGHFISYASTCECDLSVMLLQGCCRLPRLGL